MINRELASLLRDFIEENVYHLKLSRRTFDGSRCIIHTLSLALPDQQSVNINDYNPHDWIASFKQAFSEGQTVVVPAGFVCDNINTGIFIPPGKRYILGSLRGNGRGDLSYRT